VRAARGPGGGGVGERRVDPHGARRVRDRLALAADALAVRPQAAFALTRGLVSPLLAAPIFGYNLLLAAAATARYAVAAGDPVPDALLAVAAAQGTALGRVLGGAWVLASPLAVQVPMLAPAYPPRWRVSPAVRFTLAAAAGFWCLLTLGAYVPALHAVRSYDAYSAERLQERPAATSRWGCASSRRSTARPPRPRCGATSRSWTASRPTR
jgi:hypothetical protein